MNLEDFKFLLQIRNMPEEDINRLHNEFQKEAWSYRALEKHVSLRKYQISKKAMIFILYTTESVIGKMVDMLKKIDKWNAKANQSVITFDHCTMYIFTELKINL